VLERKIAPLLKRPVGRPLGKISQEVVARDGEGQKDGVTMLPAAAREPPRAHLDQVRRRHERDLSRGLGRAPLPDALARKYPAADREWGWQCLA
jgi:hypothetical protein